jgi:hypothetical protein
MELRLPADNRKGPNCGVTCVAIVAKVSFKQSWDEFRRIYRGRWNGATRQPDRERVLTKFGVKFLKLSVPGCTLKNFVIKHSMTGKTYMVRTSRHVQLVRDGVVFDQNGPHGLGDWRGRKHVKDVLLIG